MNQMKHKTIFFLEDEPAAIDGLRKLLEARGYETQIGSTRGDAVVAAQHGVRVFVLDVVFGRGRLDHSGIKVIQEIRRLAPSAIIALYSVSAEHYRDVALQLGADLAVMKTRRYQQGAALLENGILNKIAERAEARSGSGNELIRFMLVEFGIPLSVGVVGSAAWWYGRPGVGTPVLPLLIAIAIAIFTADYKGARHTSISETAVFRMFHRAKGWIVGTIAAGIAWDLFKERFPWLQ
jgi:CheY-like chemotaxis protein